MPRPIRIEYPNAYYHVMNRGRRRETIFGAEQDYQLFLTTLSEAHQRFGIQIMAYCLMSNHYHILVKTPEANLGRAMRHINGVYTQRYNRLHKTDGSLFRGRYKAIVIEEDSYQQQVSRYIHRNPIEAGIVKKLKDYPWSSYQAYIQQAPMPQWLSTQEINAYFSNQPSRYRAFVESGIDEEIAAFYGKGNIIPYLGSDEFRQWAYAQRMTDEQELTQLEKNKFKPAMETIVTDVAKLFHVSVESILTSRRGVTNVPRWAAMYLCQIKADYRLIEIAKFFGLKKSGSIPNIIAKFKQLMEKDRVLKEQISQYDI